MLARDAISMALTIGVLAILFGSRPITKLAGGMCVAAAVGGAVALELLR